ncbi:MULTISPECIES: hypothetical protein [Streptomyces]|uniref:hypothetical protein n=1 Tax=Streptomyces TaxID=1883 RepID=UPI002E2A92A8|nr:MULTISPECIES: hypothetical protein [Streptomyces]
MRSLARSRTAEAAGSPLPPLPEDGVRSLSANLGSTLPGSRHELCGLLRRILSHGLGRLVRCGPDRCRLLPHIRQLCESGLQLRGTFRRTVGGYAGGGRSRCFRRTEPLR